MNNIDSERLDQMREVLQWASEHVVALLGPAGKDPMWSATTMVSHYDAPTLYECLLNAWVDAHPKP